MILLALAAIVAPSTDITLVTDEEFCVSLKSSAAKAGDDDLSVDCQAKTFNISVEAPLKINPAKDALAIERIGWHLVCQKPGPGVTEFNRRGWHYKIVAAYGDGTVLTHIPDCTAGPPR